MKLKWRQARYNYVSKVKDKKGCHFLCQNVQNKALSFWLVDVFWGAKIPVSLPGEIQFHFIS